MTPTEGQPLSIDDLRDIIRRERKSKRLIRIMAGLVAVAAIAFAVVAGNLQHSVNQVNALSARNDCSREYSAILNRADRQLATSGWLQVDRLGTALFHSASTGQRASAQDIVDFGDGSAQLHAAIVSVLTLPNIDDAVDHGFTFDGVKHPACPKI